MTKPFALRLSPDTHSWLVRKALSLGKFADWYAAEIIEQARALDEGTVTPEDSTGTPCGVVPFPDISRDKAEDFDGALHYTETPGERQ